MIVDRIEDKKSLMGKIPGSKNNNLSIFIVSNETNKGHYNSIKNMVICENNTLHRRFFFLYSIEKEHAVLNVLK